MLASSIHWPELRVVVVVLNNAEKSVGSSKGMNLSVQTSQLMNARVNDNVPERVQK